MATTAADAAAEADDAKQQAHDDAAVGSISHILRTLFRGLYEEADAPEEEAAGPAPAEAPACITDEASVASLRMELQTEPWFDAIRCHAKRIVQEGRLPVTTDGLYNAVGLTEISQRANHQAERIANVMTAIGFVQNRRAIGNGNKQRGWWLSDQPDRPKRRF